RDRLRLAARPPRVPELRGGNLGTGRGRRAAAPGRARMAQTLKATSVAEIEALLDETPSQRTSVATHMAWVPPEWVDAAERVLHGLGPRIPSRTILLHPDPKAKRDGLDASIEHERFPGEDTSVCVEIVRLQIPDLPVFLRWRGRPPFGRTELEQLVGVSDRLIVDSAEWRGLPRAYERLAELFGRIAASDLAWARTLPWRAGLADLWPGVRKARTLEVTGPRAEALLLTGWLRSRLR